MHAKGFVHADMNMRQFTQTQEQKQESFLTLYLKAMQAQKSANTKRGVNTDAAGMVMLLKILTMKDSSLELKRLLAQQFDTVEDLIAGVETGGGTALIGERNRVALEVMDQQIAAGKKRLAIFYGAAHLADMEERLLKQGYKRVKVEWLKAWDLPKAE
jgi:triphosphoribosyl-dephospho-CoA synthetase